MTAETKRTVLTFQERLAAVQWLQEQAIDGAVTRRSLDMLASAATDALNNGRTYTASQIKGCAKDAGVTLRTTSGVSNMALNHRITQLEEMVLEQSQKIERLEYLAKNMQDHSVKQSVKLADLQAVAGAKK